MHGFIPNLDAILTILGFLLFFNNGIAYFVHITFPIKLTSITFLKSSTLNVSIKLSILIPALLIK